MTTQTLIFLGGALAALFFLSRSLAGGRFRFGDMFRREETAALPGLGPAAIATLLQDVAEFAQARQDVRAAVLVGSFARSTARADSDVDIVIVCDDPQRFRSEPWLGNFRYVTRGHPVQKTRDMAFGKVWSRIVTLRGAPEIEFSFADRAWMDARPIDEGTRKVVAQTCIILHDPSGALGVMVEAAGGRAEPLGAR